MVSHDDATRALKTRKIRELNDRLRRTGIGGKVVMTRAVAALSPEDLGALIKKVREFDAFTPGNDPWGEHDFGEVVLNGERYFWKIDAYDVNLEFGSPDPADDTITARVMTIMGSDL